MASSGVAKAAANSDARKRSATDTADSSGAGAKFPAQAGKYGASLPKGPLIQLFGGYEGAKQTLGASREDRARFERAGKIVEQRATVLSRQMKGM